MTTDELLGKLWEQYSANNPSVKRIHELFAEQGEQIENDHIAFRTFNDHRVNIDVLARPFVLRGYKEAGSYHFPEKKLFAKHFELEGKPRVFISELQLEAFSEQLQTIVSKAIDEIPETLPGTDEFVFSGSIFPSVTFESYQLLRVESEYAAWVYAFGYRANHFTVNINALQRLNNIEKVNDFLKSNGFKLNTSGGEIKGSPELLLEQSSTLADSVEIAFSDGKFIIPSCYYEFAHRYPDRKGKLFSGFVANSADKIFESTDVGK